MAKMEWGNPYSHEEHSRESLPKSEWISEGVDSCDWCGSEPRTLFKYDGTDGWFCNKDCWDAYHN